MKTTRYQTGTSRKDFKIVQREEIKNGGTRPRTIKKGTKKKKKGGNSGSTPRLLSVAHAQGLRPEMEDAAAAKRLGEWSILAVFDGHGGDAVSKWLALRLVPELLQRLHVLNPADGSEARNKIAHVITRAYLELDRTLLDEKSAFRRRKYSDRLGCTGISLFLCSILGTRVLSGGTPCAIKPQTRNLILRSFRPFDPRQIKPRNSQRKERGRKRLVPPFLSIQKRKRRACIVIRSKRNRATV